VQASIGEFLQLVNWTSRNAEFNLLLSDLPPRIEAASLVRKLMVIMPQLSQLQAS